MAFFRDAREALLLSYDENLIDTEEFCLLYDLNTSQNLDYPYWNYEYFNLDNLSEPECKAELRFLRNDVHRLAEVINIPDEITTYNRSKFDGLEANLDLLYVVISSGITGLNLMDLKHFVYF